MTDATNTGAPPPDPAPRRSPPWLRVVLVVSLAANLLVVGLVAGTMLGRPGDDRHERMPRDMTSAVYLWALPHEHRGHLEAEMRRLAPDPSARREALATEVAETLAVLRAEPFDAAAFGARIAGQRGVMAERSALGDRLFLARVAAMSAAERQGYADELERIVERALRRRGGREGG